jgi:hypothetical protein
MWISRAKQRQREDDAYQQGADDLASDYEDSIEGKDIFILEQSGIIVGLMEIINEADAWSRIPDPLFEKLRSYV